MTLNFGLAAGLGVAAIALSPVAALAVDAMATGSANVRSGPGTSYSIVDTLSSGEMVEVVECNGSQTWCRITHPGPDGWVSRSLLGAPDNATDGDGNQVQFGMTMPLPGGGSITFGTPGYQPPQPPPPPPGPKQVCVYDFANYGGQSVCVNAGMSATNVPGWWNNRVSSLRVFGGAHVRLCQDPNFGGFCNVFGTDVPQLGAPLNNKSSSYQVW
ncbi:SH3 domain-containing protein [Devosia sp. A16]|uniref:SH3 domain-containing protein n=1 Tax=Devosia sp. A16 TaxID=1736675 RepID=UPI0006D784DE|nr:SH3 domain-containing protein [Devosia sp. A16]